jgi:hypothetical protein
MTTTALATTDRALTASDRYLELSETPEKDLTRLISYGIINEK